jgi:hypothetical protein
MTHQQAMKAASGTWGKEKDKIMRREKRECKSRVAKKPPPKKEAVPETENEKSSAE